ncbi:hypothetical protein DK058_25365, partial [Salmonella enterica subsp. enterica serovar Typhi]|nr:hypothetical protein [Salmonella enterica subsp. enterica serovar Typhi]
DDFAAAESVCHVGGAGAAVRHAIRCWRMGLPASRLKRLRAVADASEAAFDAACRPHYCDGRWGAYRAIECGQVVPGPVTDAMDDYLAATHAFYAARDGDKGFLGSRGL